MSQPVRLDSTSPITARRAAAAALVRDKPPPAWLERSVHQGAVFVRFARRAERIAGGRADFVRRLDEEARALLKLAEQLEAMAVPLKQRETLWWSRLDPRRWTGIETVLPALFKRWLWAGRGLAATLLELAGRAREERHIVVALRELLAGSGRHGLLRALLWLEPEAVCGTVVLQLYRRLHRRAPSPKAETSWRACETIWLAAGGIPGRGHDPLARWEHYLNVPRGKNTPATVAMQAQALIGSAIIPRESS